jgi:hypothetical protein
MRHRCKGRRCATALSPWEFSKLENNIFTKDPAQLSATEDLQKVFDLRHWLFREAEQL